MVGSSNFGSWVRITTYVDPSIGRSLRTSSGHAWITCRASGNRWRSADFERASTTVTRNPRAVARRGQGGGARGAPQKENPGRRGKRRRKKTAPPHRLL